MNENTFLFSSYLFSVFLLSPAQKAGPDVGGGACDPIVLDEHVLLPFLVFLHVRVVAGQLLDDGLDLCVVIESSLALIAPLSRP